ncbi:hypothetical protein GGR56DRAFT_684216 [Xylariaceae sp. FL0804]|nr:hypothetical protein GGR56DRAFT_684216 [Xylariaceae sp. FL0804]
MSSSPTATSRNHGTTTPFQRNNIPWPRPSSAEQSAPKPRAEAEKPAPPREDLAIPVPNTVAPLPFWQRLGPLTRTGEAYVRAQRRRPWATQLASTLVIYFCADVSAQRINAPRAGGEEHHHHDFTRTARSLAIGGAGAVPAYEWFTFLARNFNYASRVLSVAVKVLLNQTLWTPVFSSYFFGAQALLAGESPAEAWDRVCRTVPVSWTNSCKLWPAITAFSFAFVPIEYRSIFAGCISVGWQTYLSFLNRQAETAEEAARALSMGPAAPRTEVPAEMPAEGQARSSKQT